MSGSRSANATRFSAGKGTARGGAARLLSIDLTVRALPIRNRSVWSVGYHEISEQFQDATFDGHNLFLVPRRVGS